MLGMHRCDASSADRLYADYEVRLGAQRRSKALKGSQRSLKLIIAACRFLLILIAYYDWIAARNARTVVWKQRLETRRRYQSIIRSNSKRVREKQDSSSFPRFDTWKFTRYWRWRQVDANRLSTFNSGRNQPHSATASLPLSDTVRRSTIAVSNCTRRNPWSESPLLQNARFSSSDGTYPFCAAGTSSVWLSKRISRIVRLPPPFPRSRGGCFAIP